MCAGEQTLLFRTHTKQSSVEEEYAKRNFDRCAMTSAVFARENYRSVKLVARRLSGENEVAVSRQNTAHNNVALRQHESEPDFTTR